MVLAVEISRPQKSPQNPQNRTLNCFIRQNNLFFVHLSHSGAILDFSGRNLREGGHIDSPQTSPNFGTQNLLYTSNLISKIFNRLHRVPGVAIRHLACLTLNSEIQNFLTFFLDSFNYFPTIYFHCIFM